MELVVHAGWVLIAAVAISLAYETFRAVARAGVSTYDSPRSLMIGIPLYAVIVAVAWLLFAGETWVVWVAFIMTVGLIAISIFYYSPVMLAARRPAMIDHLEDKLYTGLLFVAAALLVYRIAGVSLS